MTKSGKFGALADFRQQQQNETTLPTDKGDQGEAAPPPVLSKGRGRPAGKRSNPDYEPTTVLLRKQTKRAAGRKLEDVDAKQDLSELIEELLKRWISAHT